MKATSPARATTRCWRATRPPAASSAFLTAPKGSEVTGQTWSGDKRTHFVGIQHPDAPFPDGEGKLPRSALIAIKRDDNVKIG